MDGVSKRPYTKRGTERFATSRSQGSSASKRIGGIPEQWHLPDCFALLRRRMEAEDATSGTRSFIRVLRLPERFSLDKVTAGIEYALDIGLSDSDSIRSVVEHQADGPVRLFSLDGRPHLACVRVETTPVAAYQSLLSEVVT